MENKDKLLYCVPSVGNSIFPIGYLFNDDKLQCEWQKQPNTLCSRLKLIQKNYIFTYMPISINALLDLDSFVIYFVYCVCLKNYYIHWIGYYFFFIYFFLPFKILWVYAEEWGVLEWLLGSSGSASPCIRERENKLLTL